MFHGIGPSVAPVLYRSVSPWEMRDIVERGLVTGRGGEFSGDRRISPDCHVWFGESIDPIIHSGEDYLRFAQGMVEWTEMLSTLHALRDLANTLHRRLATFGHHQDYLSMRFNRQWLELDRQHRVVKDVEGKLSEAYRKAICAVAHQARSSAERLPVTSFIIEVHGAPGGMRYWDDDSLQAGTPEVCFPRAAAGALYARITVVHLVKRHPDRLLAIVGQIPKDRLEWLSVRLPNYRQATVQAALRFFERLRPRVMSIMESQ